MKQKNIKNAMLAVLFCIGLLLTSYPYLQRFFFNLQVRSTISEFREQQSIWPSSPVTAGAEEEPAAGDPILYEDLLQAMQDYNSALFASAQSDLVSAASYETPALDLRDFGLSFDTIGYISIPVMDVELPLYLGASEEHMSLGAAVLGQTSLPIGGENTNCVIAAHRGYQGIPYFREIELLDVGDIVEVTTLWETLTYEVTGWQIIEPDSVDQVLIQPGKDMVTLLTCHPYRVGTDRYLVYCERKTVLSDAPESTNQPMDDPDYLEVVSPLTEPLTTPAINSSQAEIELEEMMQIAGLAVVLIAGTGELLLSIKNKA